MNDLKSKHGLARIKHANEWTWKHSISIQELNPHLIHVRNFFLKKNLECIKQKEEDKIAMFPKGNNCFYCII